MTPAAPAERMAVAFARVLRGASVQVPIGSVLAFVEAVGALDLADRDHVYWAGRTTLVRRPEDRQVYDRAFAVFWEQRRTDDSPTDEEEPLRITLTVDDESDGDDQQGDAQASDDPQITLRFSAGETLRQKDCADYTDDELRREFAVAK